MGSATPPSRVQGWQLGYFQYLENQVTFADTKAGLLLTADSILLTGLGLATGGFSLHTPALVFVLVAAGLLVAGVGVTLIAIAPNPWHFRRVPPPLNHFQFSAVARRFTSQSDYVASLAACEEAQIEAELLQIIYGKSHFAFRKYRWLSRAVRLTFAAVISGTVAATLEGVIRAALS